MTLEGYTSTTQNGRDKWVSFFHIYDGAGLAKPSDFTGLIKLDNNTLYSEQVSSGIQDVDDRLIVRKPGSVQLVLSDHSLKGAAIDMTRAHCVNIADNGTAYEGKERMVLYNILVLDDNASIAGLQGDLIGKTHDSEYYGQEYSIASEVDTMRVVTQDRTQLTIDVARDHAYSYAGSLGTASTYGSSTTGKIENGTKGTETLSLTKSGEGAQYIHTAVVRNMAVESGVLGFNNLDLNGSLILYGNARLQLGVSQGIASDGGIQQWGAGSDTVVINPNRALTIMSSSTMEVTEPGGEVRLVPLTAYIEGTVTISDTSYLSFECTVLPSQMREHPLLAVLANGESGESGRLNLEGDVVVMFRGYDFGALGGDIDTYYLATTQGGVYTNGILGAFQTRTISIGDGYFGIIKLSDDKMDLVMTVTNKPIRTWYNGESGLKGAYGTAADNIWYGSNETYGQPVSDTDPTLRGTDRYHWQEGLDSNLGENGYYKDTYHVAFGSEGAGKTGAVEEVNGEDYNVVLLKGEVSPASVRVKDDVNYIFRSYGDTNGCIADGGLPDDPAYEGSSGWKTILTKDGAGALIIETANTFSGGTTLNKGTIVMRNESALGSGLVLMDDGTTLALDFRTSGFTNDIAWLRNKISIRDKASAYITHSDKVTGGIISVVEGGAESSLVLLESNSAENWSLFNLMDGTTFMGSVKVGSMTGVSGLVELALTRDTWSNASFDLSLNGAQTSVLHINTRDLQIGEPSPSSYMLSGIAGGDSSSRVTTSNTALRGSAAKLTVNTQNTNEMYYGDIGFGEYVGLLASDGINYSGYFDLVKKGGFCQTFRNGRLARLDIQNGDLMFGDTLFITDGLSVADTSRLVVGSMSKSDVDDYDVIVRNKGTLRLGAQGFGSLTGTSYTDSDGTQRIGNTVLLREGTLGVIDADWSTDYEITLDSAGGARQVILDTTGYDPDTMLASGSSYTMTLNGMIRSYANSQLIADNRYNVVVKNGNAGQDGRVVLGGANRFAGQVDVTDHAALELANASALGTDVDVKLSGRNSRLDVRSGVVSYARSVALSGEGASINILRSSNLSDSAVTVTARFSAASSSLTGARLGTSNGSGLISGNSSSLRALFKGTDIMVRQTAGFINTELTSSLLTVAAGQSVVVQDMLVHAGDSGIVLNQASSLSVVAPMSGANYSGLTVSYADVNWSQSSDNTWTTNALIALPGDGTGVSIDFAGGVNLLLTECSSQAIDRLLASNITLLHFVLFENGGTANEQDDGRTGYEVAFDMRLAEAGFAVVNGGTWDKDGVVILARSIIIPEPASMGMLGMAALLLLRRRRSPAKA